MLSMNMAWVTVFSAHAEVVQEYAILKKEVRIVLFLVIKLSEVNHHVHP